MIGMSVYLFPSPEGKRQFTCVKQGQPQHLSGAGNSFESVVILVPGAVLNCAGIARLMNLCCI